MPDSFPFGCEWNIVCSSTNMIIDEMKRDECIALLTRNRLGRIACSRGDQPYIVPMYFAYRDEHLYGFSTAGQKIEWLRLNPRVCVEVEEITVSTKWASVVVVGKFTELTDTPDLAPERADAYRALNPHASWWEPALVRLDSDPTKHAHDAVYFRVSIDEITGRLARS